MEVYEGESIDEVVAVYARAYDLPEESQARLAAVIHDRARSRRLVPAATVPTQIVDAEGQARVLDLPIFVGDTEQEAVDRFLASLGIDKATMTQEQARGGWLWESVRVHGHRDAGAGEGAGSGHHH